MLKSLPEGVANRLNFAYKIFGPGPISRAGGAFSRARFEAEIFLEPGLPGGCFPVTTSNIFRGFSPWVVFKYEGGDLDDLGFLSLVTILFSFKERRPGPGVQTGTGTGFIWLS
jgi:hypothetical protein